MSTPPRVGGSPNSSPHFSPIVAQSFTIHQSVDPVAFDCVRLIFVRDGSAVSFCEFGQRPVTVGDVILLGAHTLCGWEPEVYMTVTTVSADTDYVVDQVFWQHSGILQDRLHAQNFAATIYTEPAQLLRLGEDRAGMLMPWLDELVALSVQNHPVEDFYRTQALWFNIAHVIAPFIKTSPVRISPTQRATTWPTTPRIRSFGPLRADARRVSELLKREPERRWSVTELAKEVHLSTSQLGRVFAEAYGKSPIAYLTMLRVGRMAALLRTTDNPITAIAQEVGWSDPDFAARQFRRSVGVSPSEYRRISRKGNRGEDPE